MIVHIRSANRTLCGGSVWSLNARVFTMAPAARFADVTCAACLRLQVTECQRRAMLETTPQTVACERAAERVCLATLGRLSMREAS